MNSSLNHWSYLRLWIASTCCVAGATTLLVSLTGCKASWQRVNDTVVSDEPSFDRLLELEGSGEAAMSPVSTAGSSRKVSQQRDPSPSQRFKSSDDSLGEYEGTSGVSEASFLERTERALKKSEKFRNAQSRSLSDDDKIKPVLYEEPVRTERQEEVATADNEANSDDDSYYSLSDRDEPSREEVSKQELQRDARKIEPAVATGRTDESSMVRDAAVNDIRELSSDSSFEDVAGPGVSDPQQDLTWQEHLNLAIRGLSDEEIIPLTPEEKLRRAAITRMLHLSLGNEAAAMEQISGIDPAEKDYFIHQMQALHNAINPSANPVASRRWSLVMMSQQKATGFVSSLSDLVVNNAAFCTEVEGFGVVRKFPDYNFAADQELLLYCELDNFVCEETKSGFETQLQGSYEIVDAGGRRVAHQSLPLDSHTCRNRRRDYYIAYRIYMPPKIDRGDYTLKLLIEDVKGRKFGESSLDFTISR